MYKLDDELIWMWNCINNTDAAWENVIALIYKCHEGENYEGEN